jgi:hypothetical protein
LRKIDRTEGKDEALLAACFRYDDDDDDDDDDDLIML